MGNGTNSGHGAGNSVPLGSLPHALSLLKLLYKKEGFAFDGLLGTAISKEFEVNVEASKFASMFALLDEVIAVFHNLNLAMIASIASGQEDAAFNYRFSNSTKNSLCAIRMLLSKGFDLEARVQLRAFRELIIAWLFLDKFPEKREEFSKPQTLEDANHYWYLNLRKAERTMQAAAPSGSFHPRMDKKLIEIEKILNTAAHPSWVGIDISARTDFYDPSDSLNAKSASNASIFSLAAALTFAAFAYGPLKPVSFAVPATLAHLFPRHSESQDVNETLAILQKMPALIFLFGCLIAEQLSNHPDCY